MPINFERIMAIGAHPDDIELGCFGTLAKFRDSGSAVAFVVLTYGGVNGDKETRKKEAEESAALLSAKCYFGGLNDTEIPEGNPTIKIIEDAINDFKPTAIFINSKNDTHQDHRNAANAAISASRFVPTVLFYQTPSSNRSFTPQVFVDITDTIKIKLESTKIHSSQGDNVYMADRAIEGLSEFLGLQIYRSSRYFEGFEVHQIVI